MLQILINTFYSFYDTFIIPFAEDRQIVGSVAALLVVEVELDGGVAQITFLYSYTAEAEKEV